MKNLILGHMFIWSLAIILGCASTKPCKKYGLIYYTDYVRVNEYTEIPVTTVRSVCVE